MSINRLDPHRSIGAISTAISACEVEWIQVEVGGRYTPRNRIIGRDLLRKEVSSLAMGQLVILSVTACALITSEITNPWMVSFAKLRTGARCGSVNDILVDI